jgi:Tfp pilus assembly protein PilP
MASLQLRVKMAVGPFSKSKQSNQLTYKERSMTGPLLTRFSVWVANRRIEIHVQSAHRKGRLEKDSLIS